jgi:hypothetical protein
MKRLLGILGAGIFLALAFIGSASAQQVNLYCWVDNGPPIHWAPCSPTNQLQVSGGGGGGGLSVTDQAIFTAGASSFTPGGGFYNSSQQTLVSGTQGTFALSSVRSLEVDTPTTNSNLNTILTAPQPYLPATTPTTNTYTTGVTSPINGDLHGAWYSDISAWAGTQLGAPSNYGTSPGVVAVPGVNAFITNTVGITANSSVNVAQFGGVSTATGQVAVSTAPVTATNTALVVDLRPDSPGILTLGVAADTASVPVVLSPSGNATAGITPVVGGSAVSSLVLKASAGSLYSAYAECTAACWLMVFNATAAPSNGSTTAGVASGNMVECVPIASGGTGSIDYNPGPPEVFSVGITVAISSTTCATLTLATTGFVHGMIK